jgi:hypothetical protein
MCRRGATDGEIAEALSVTRFTIVNWQARYPDFAEAFKLGREPATDRVERSAYERAVGYTFDSEKIVVVNKKVERVAIREHIPPDPGAQQYWLNNRRRQEWASRNQVEVGAPGDFDRLSDDDLRKFIEAEVATVAGSSSLAPTGIAPAPRPAAPRRVAKKPVADDDLFG